VQLSNLPNPDSLNNLEYSVLEFPVPEPFKAEYLPAIINANDKTITISVKNVSTPDNPVPNTGDNSIVYFTTMISSFSLLAIAMILIKRKRFEKAWLK
jgi:LPXTG-motif cell wall-anchored protein